MATTPVKSVILKLNDLCRVCGENIRCAGRGSLNMFRGEKSKKSLLHERFSKLLLDEIVKDDRKSECVCNKCVRELEKFEKAMLNADELRKKYRSVKILSEQLAKRDKRCNSSPSSGIKRTCSESSVRQNPMSRKSTKRTLLTDLDKENEILTTLSEIANIKCSNIDETKVEVNGHILMLFIIVFFITIIILCIYLLITASISRSTCTVRLIV